MVNNQPPSFPNPNFIDFAGYGTYPSSSSRSTPSVDPNGKRARTKFNEFQLRHLERYFEKSQYPQGGQREQLATSLTLTETKIQVWFKNRRAKMRANKKYEELRQQSVASMAGSSSNGIGIKKEKHPVEPGGTEEENECRGRGGQSKSSSKPIKASPHHFPVSMPLIPLPTDIDFNIKIDPPPEPSSAVNVTLSTNSTNPANTNRSLTGNAAAEFLPNMAPFNPLHSAVPHSTWIPPAYPSGMFNPANYGFANPHSASTYYPSAPMNYDLYNSAYYYSSNVFTQQQKFQ